MTRFIKPYWKQSLLALFFLFGVVVSDLLIPRLTQRVIDQGVTRQDMHVIVTTSALMLGAAALSALFAIANTLLAVRVGQGLSADLRSAIVRQVQTFSFGNLDHIQTGQLLVRATSDVNQVQTIIQMSLRILTRAPLWVVGSMVMLVATSTRLSLLMLAMLPLIGGIIWFFLTQAQPLFLAVQKKLDRLNQVLQENLAGTRVVKAFVRVAHENARFDRANEGLMAENIRVMRLIAVLIPTMMFLVNLAVVGVVWFGGEMAIASELTVGEMVAAINYMMFSLFPLMMLGGMIGPISAAEASAGRIWEVLDSDAQVKNHPQARPLNGVRGRVAFEDVYFSYNHGGDAPVLRGVNLVAEPGQTVAILGATGSGKSSLVHLIPRFYDVQRGRITLDGVDVRDIPLETLRGQIGIALQEAVLFNATVRENIRYGRPNATDQDVVAAAQAAQAHDFITAFPDGYDTQIGQRGVNLSGGQKQRLAIARALLVQPKILILDDSTSAVDVETEVKIQAALEELVKDQTSPSAPLRTSPSTPLRTSPSTPLRTSPSTPLRTSPSTPLRTSPSAPLRTSPSAPLRTSPSAPLRTSFVIAQRISTVLDADKIVVLDQGRVAAEGPHAELMASSPIYREIYASQLGAGDVYND